jgi:hypothetical protein
LFSASDHHRPSCPPFPLCHSPFCTPFARISFFFTRITHTYASLTLLLSLVESVRQSVLFFFLFSLLDIAVTTMSIRKEGGGGGGSYSRVQSGRIEREREDRGKGVGVCLASVCVV